MLFPVIASVFVVVIFAVLINCIHDVISTASVQVSIIVHPLPAGSVPIEKLFVFKVTCPFIVSTILTLSADFPQLFP